MHPIDSALPAKVAADGSAICRGTFQYVGGQNGTSVGTYSSADLREVRI